VHVNRKVRSNRRGIAMLLVIISLSMATVLAVSYLSSRDNSADIGENINRAAVARAAASAALDLGEAILQTESDWRTAHTGGKLLDDFPVGEALIDLDLWDLNRNQVPDETTSLVRITTTARVGQIEQVATAIVRLLGPGFGGSVDVDLSEFAIFTEKQISLQDTSTLTRWPDAPLTNLGQRVAIGTRAEAAGNVYVGPFAAAIDATVYHDVTASESLVSVANTLVMEEVEILDPIPSPMPAAAPVADPDPSSPLPAALFEFGTTDVAVGYRAGSINLNQATVTVIGDGTFVSDTDIVIDNNSILEIDGNVTIVAFGNVRVIGGSAIELKDPDDSLRIYVADLLIMQNGYVGDHRTDNTRDVDGTASWMDPERLVIYGSGDATNMWQMNGDSVVKASIYAPQVDFRMHDLSALYGRVAANTLEMTGGTSIYYDHTLDGGFGYSNLQSPVYDETDHILQPLQDLTSMDAANLDAAADLVGYPLECSGTTYDGSLPLIPPVLPPLPPDTPTPRSVGVGMRGPRHPVRRVRCADQFKYEGTNGRLCGAGSYSTPPCLRASAHSSLPPSLQSIFLELPVERALTDAQQPRGLLTVAAGHRQRLADGFLFELVEPDAGE
jgi:hypothetical protein